VVNATIEVNIEVETTSLMKILQPNNQGAKS